MLLIFGVVTFTNPAWKLASGSVELMARLPVAIPLNSNFKFPPIGHGLKSFWI